MNKKELHSLYLSGGYIATYCGVHPAKQVEELTPRLWKEMFVESPLRSEIYDAD